MPNPIKNMERKRHREEQLRRNLRHDRPRREPSRQRCRAQVQSQNRRGEVPDPEEVEATRQHDTGDAVEHRRVPGDLRAVDGQVRGDGAVAALLDEDLVGVGGGEELLRCDGAAGCVSTGGAEGPAEVWGWAYRVWIWDVRERGAARFFAAAWEITERWATI